MKYLETLVVFAEVPDEVTLAINLTGCPCHCAGCHSPWLADDIGEPLDEAALDALISRNRGITCVCFMGGDADPAGVSRLAAHVKSRGLLSAWYSGREQLPDAPGFDLAAFDFVKIGPYRAECGPLSSPSTNQRLYRVAGGRLADDITARMRR